MNARRLLGGAVLAIAAVLLIGRWTASLYADYHWYLALNAAEVWRAKAVATTALTLGSFTIASLFAFANLYAVRQSVVALVLPRRIANIEIGEEVNGRYLVAIAAGLSVAIGVALVFPPDRWAQALLARIGQPFHESEPNTEIDLGFFVYWLPFESALHSWAVIVLTVVCVVVVLLYALTPSLKWDRGALYVSAYVRRHVTVLGAFVVLLLAWSYRLAMFRMLFAGTGQAGLFTGVDHQQLTAMLLLSVVTAGAACVVAWAGWSGQMRLAFSTVTVVLVLSLVGRTIVPLVMRRGLDAHDKRTRDGPYVNTRLSYTQRAFGVDASERMSRDTIGSGFAAPVDVSSRVAIWDGLTLTRATARMRHVRTFGAGPAWAATSGRIAAQVVERGTESTPEVRDVWSIARFDPSAADEKGQPLRVNGGNDDIFIPEPVVYDSAPGYSVLSDSAHQIIGVEMQSIRSRLLHAWSLQNFRLLFGDLPGSYPVIVERRDIRDRLSALVPFFEQGSEVVPLVANDTLYWIVELYSASDSYPLSVRININGEDHAYFQHAATAIVHAQSGRVRLLLSASRDPVAASWVNRFPNLFLKTIDALPPGVAAALPPVLDGARAQALAFAMAGFPGDGPTERRHFAIPDGADSAAAREPLRVALPGSGGVAALWTLLDSADRVRGVIAAPGGRNRVPIWIPMATDGRRWGSVVDRLRAADTALHDVGGTRAALRALPVSGKPMYIQPAFLSRPGGAPTLAHVTLMVNDSVRVGATLAGALGSSAPSHPPATEAPTDLRARADSLYRQMREAMARGDWAGFGRAFDALGGVIRGLPR